MLLFVFIKMSTETTNTTDYDCEDMNCKIRKLFYDLNVKTNNQINISVENTDHAALLLANGDITEYQLQNAINKNTGYRMFTNEELQIIKDKKNIILETAKIQKIYENMTSNDFINAAEILGQILYFNQVKSDFETFFKERFNRNVFYIFMYIPELVISTYPIDEDSYQYFHTNEENDITKFTIHFYDNVQYYIDNFLIKFYVNMQNKIYNKLNSIFALSDNVDETSITYKMFLKKGLWTNKSNFNSFLASIKKTTTIEKFTELFYTQFKDIPKYIWECFNTLMSKNITKNTIKYLPNNFTLYNKSNEITKSVKMILNIIYFSYGTINNGLGKQVMTTEEKGKNALLSEGGKNYAFNNDDMKFSTVKYSPFLYIDTTVNTNVINTEQRITPTFSIDENIITIDNFVRYDWTTSYLSFLLQSISEINVVIPDNIKYYFVQANGILTTNEYITELITNYTNNLSTKNAFLWSFADYITVIEQGETTQTQKLISYIFNNSIGKLSSWHLTFPYNNILSFDYINRIHINDKAKDITAQDLDNTVLPQYMYIRNDKVCDNTKPKMNTNKRQSKTISKPSSTNKKITIEKTKITYS